MLKWSEYLAKNVSDTLKLYIFTYIVLYYQISCNRTQNDLIKESYCEWPSGHEETTTLNPAYKRHIKLLFIRKFYLCMSIYIPAFLIVSRYGFPADALSLVIVNWIAMAVHNKNNMNISTFTSSLSMTWNQVNIEGNSLFL